METQLTNLTEQEIEEGKAFLPDLDLILNTFNGLYDQMSSQSGRDFISQFLETAIPHLKQMKATMYVELGLI